MVAQLDRVTGYEPVGRGFESLSLHHQIHEDLLHGFFAFQIFWSPNLFSEVDLLYLWEE